MNDTLKRIGMMVFVLVILSIAITSQILVSKKFIDYKYRLGYYEGAQEGVIKGIKKGMIYSEEGQLECFKEDFVSSCNRQTGVCMVKIDNSKCEIRLGMYVTDEESGKTVIGDIPKCVGDFVEREFSEGLCFLFQKLHKCSCQKNGEEVSCDTEKINNWDCESKWKNKGDFNDNRQHI